MRISVVKMCLQTRNHLVYSLCLSKTEFCIVHHIVSTQDLTAIVIDCIFLNISSSKRPGWWAMHETLTKIRKVSVTVINILWILLVWIINWSSTKFSFSLWFVLETILCNSLLKSITIYLMFNGLIDWCLTQTLAVFQPYRGVNKLYINIRNV